MSAKMTDGEPLGVVVGLFAGKPQSLWAGKPPSAILKQPAAEPVEIDASGFLGDQQADLSVHGGEEKAIHHYAAEHLDFWRERFPDDAGKFVPGCFGENVSTTGLTESNLCLGDLLTLGTATVQVCQGRQPCWKLNAHLDNRQLAAQFQKTGRTGWYYRVIDGGSVSVGDRMRLVSRAHPGWPLERLIRSRFNPKISPDLAGELAAIPELSRRWRIAFEKKTDSSFVEDTRERLHGG